MAVDVGMSGGATRVLGHRYGVVGHPVEHSLSPDIHRAFALQTDLSIDYERIAAPVDGFADAIGRFFAAGGRGLNVTVPFKPEAFAACDGRVSERARRAGAVNWLARSDAGVVGDNTDGDGLVRDLGRLLGDDGLAGLAVLVAGAGGATRGIVGPLFDAGIDRMTIVARDVARAAALAIDLAPRRIDCATFAQVADQSFDLVVNATSAGLGDASLPLSPRTLRANRLVYDLMYGAQPTRFLADATAAGATRVADGLGMLVEQAAESFRLWHGVMPDTRPVLDDLRASLATR